MIVQIIRIIYLSCLFCLPGHLAFSQNYSSRNNYTGDWETPESWNPTWPVPLTNINGQTISINGHIGSYHSLSFSGSSGNLIVNDTLVIKGDLTLDNNNDLKINDNGILIVRGNLNIGNQSNVTVNGYLIITGNINKESSINHGSFKGNNNPVKLFIGGIISLVGITTDPAYPALNCLAPVTIPYPNTTCSYGNMTDLAIDPIYSFFQTTCIIPSPTMTADGPITFCDGGSVTLTSSAGTSYLWSTGATTEKINVSSTGNYAVRITNSNGCQSALSAITSVSVNALPVTPAITSKGPTTFCAGDSVSLTSSAGKSYLWSTGATTSKINVTTSGNYTVIVGNASGCQSAVSVPTVVTVNPLPVPTITSGGPTTFCEGGSVILTCNTGTTYLWSNGATTASINVNIPGSYRVSITDANGCLSAPSTATVVNVNALPVVNAGIDATIPYGTNTTIDATISGIGPFTYNWSPPGQLINPLIEDPKTVNLTASTVFTLLATSATTSCHNTDDIIITISGGPLSSAPHAAPGTICAGSDVYLHALASGGSRSYTYTWTSTPAGFTSSVANPKVNPVVNTTYNLTISDGFNTVNSQVAVTVNALPSTPTIMTDGPTSFCAGGIVKLASSAGTSYLWSNAATTSSINVSETGSFFVQVTNAEGCQSAKSAATVVTVNSLPVTPTITADGPTTFCTGGSVNLSSSAGTSYLWSNAETTPGINVTSTGSYAVQVTNAYGCQSAKSVVTIVNVNVIPPTPTITADGPLTFCAGGNVTLTSTEGTGYLWSNAATTPGINITGTGKYSVQISNANGCQSAVSAAIPITVNTLPVVNITSSNISMCMNDSRKLTASPAGGKFVILDGPGTINGNTLSANGTGIIQVEYYYTDICSNTATQSVVVNENPVANAGPDQELNYSFETQMNAELSAFETGEWSLISGSGNIIDIHSPTTSVNKLSTGENKFLWKVLIGNCYDTAKVKITVNYQPPPSVITPNGDDINDYFKISAYDGKVELIIVNRWGNVEFKNSNYLNDWNGLDNKGQELPNDTYFYILKFENGTIIKGSVLIKR